MRIDDENKVVWCSESEMSWYTSFNLSVGNGTFLNLRRINALSTEKEVLLPSYMTITDRVEIIRTISDNYEFKLEQPKKYYWRKKKEHQTKYEQEHSYGYLVKGISIPYIINGYGSDFVYTESEARDLLKDDFDKFEKVECE